MALGIVVIGRNEGERLRRCFESVEDQGEAVVYVDSGSTDGSVCMARDRGVDVVELDMSVPFSAARARNAGFARLIELSPDIEFVHFVDGDCEVVPQWFDLATGTLMGQDRVGIVCGRLRERHLIASKYHQLCEVEWNQEPGEVSECGGIFTARVDAFSSVGGFDPKLMAGEEPDLCSRMIGHGWKIARLPDDMGWHDADMTRFSQWWKRAVRSGYAYAQVNDLRRRDAPEGWLRELRSAWIWGLVVPLVGVALVSMFSGWGLLVFGLYPIWVVRIASRVRRRAGSWRVALFYGTMCLVAKWASMVGQVRYVWDRTFKRIPAPIEYKVPCRIGNGSDRN